MTETTFETKAWNRRKDPEKVLNADGSLIHYLGPDEIAILESANDRTILAPYSEVIFERNGEITLTKRPGWVDPYSKAPWRTEIVNIEGKSLEQRLVGGEILHLQRGIPVVRFVESSDPLAEFERVEIRQTKERVRLEAIPGYLGWTGVLRDVKTPRPAEEFERIKKDREQAEQAPEVE